MKRIADAAGAVVQLIAELGLPQHLSAWELTDDDLLEAVRPVASDEYPQSDLLDISRAARSPGSARCDSPGRVPG